jgi:8-oxo-dGTP diphosphatase
MSLLLTIREQDFEENAPQKDASHFRERSAARAVLLDADGRVYLLNVSKRGYHKLPGGGVNTGEDIRQALERELMEEVGCRAEIIADVGEVLEFRDYEDGGLKQTSYCFVARQMGEQEESALEENELGEGMFEVKAKSIDEAIALLEQDKPNNLEGRFIQKRDLCFLRAARSVIL